MTKIKHRPVRVVLFPNREVGIVWDDGREDYLPARALRLACPCAGCVDEITGKRTLDPGRVASDVAVDSYEFVGNYALAFRFSDGHQTGIFSYTLLRDLGAPDA